MATLKSIVQSRWPGDRSRQENPIPCEIAKPAWPQGKRFAFTIVDDTDRSTVENVGPVYDFLSELGLRTTKTIWPLAPLGPPRSSGQSLEDPDYRRWVLELKDRGFEIAMHGTSDETSTHERVLRGLNYFQDVIGQDPRLHVNHTGQVESIYWGGHGSTACRRPSTTGPGGSPRARINSTGIARGAPISGGTCAATGSRTSETWSSQRSTP